MQPSSTDQDRSQNQKTRSKPLLILDLDETLVLATETVLPDRQPDFKQGAYFIYLRPHLAAFLSRMAEHYHLAVWSAAGTLYVEPTVKRIFAALPEQARPLFVWSFPRCTRRFDHEAHEAYYIKDLKKVFEKGFDPERTLIVDDLERNSERNFGNAVYIQPYDGSLGDSELLYLADYLVELASESNFRSVEKRGWRKLAQKPPL